MRYFLFLLFQISFVGIVCANAEPKIRIVVSIQPIAEVVQAIGGDLVDVNIIIRPGESPHHFSPKPHQIEAIKKADLVVMNGAGLDNWIAKHFESEEEKMKIIRWDAIIYNLSFILTPQKEIEKDKAKKNEPIFCTIIFDSAGRKYAKISEKNLIDKNISGFQLGIDKKGSKYLFNFDENLGFQKRKEFYFFVFEEDTGSGFHKPTRPNSDPHLWLNPHNMLYLNNNVTQKIINLKKNHKENILKKSDRLNKRILQLDSNYENFFTSNPEKIVTFDNTFKHLSSRYYFDLESVSNSHHGHEVSPKRREEIVRFIKKEKIKTLFVERNTQRLDVKWIVERSGVKTSILDPNIYPGVKGYSTYFEMMESNLRSLQSTQ